MAEDFMIRDLSTLHSRKEADLYYNEIMRYLTRIRGGGPLGYLELSELGSAEPFRDDTERRQYVYAYLSLAWWHGAIQKAERRTAEENRQFTIDFNTKN